jgi:hypothetical protein
MLDCHPEEDKNRLFRAAQAVLAICTAIVNERIGHGKR